MKGWQPAGRRTLILAFAWMTLTWVTGCSRQLAGPASGATGSGQLPFDRASDGSGVSPTAAFASEAVPAGTEITVRLRAPLSSADARIAESFGAVLDESVIVAGNTFVPRGAPVTGRVVDTRVSAAHDPGYLRLTLASIAINGKSISLQTSSIFAKGGSYEKRTAASMSRSPAGGKSSIPAKSGDAALPGDVRFSTGHRFTFRLIKPLQL